MKEYIFGISIILIFFAWAIKHFLQYKLNSKLLNQEICFKVYFPAHEALLCPQCDCIFSRKDFIECPACRNSQNFHLNLAINPIMQFEMCKKLHHITLQ